MSKTISTIIEITESHVKLLQAKSIRGKRAVIACDVRALNNFTDDEIIRNLNAFIVSRNIGTDDITFVIPRKFAILKQMKLPSHNDLEIKKMIGLQLVSQLPYSVEDVIYDYQIVEKDASGYARAVVYVIHKEISDRYLNILDKVGLKPHKLTISSLGILGWVTYQSEVHKSNINCPLIVLDIDLAHSEVCFINNRQLLFSRNVDWGTQDLKEDNGIDLLGQIEMSLEAYNKENMGPAIKRVLIVSGMAEAADLRVKIEQELKLPCDIIHSVDNIYLQKGVNTSFLKSNPSLSFAVGIGQALLITKATVNLIPREIFDSEKNKKQTKKIVQITGLFLLSLFVLVSSQILEIYQKNNYLKSIETRIDDLAPKLKMAKQRIQFVNFFNDTFKNKILIADIIAELIDITPEDVSYRSLYLDDKGVFTLQGYAKKSSSVNDLQSKMLKSPIFKEVNLQFATKRMTYNIEVSDFKIVAQIAKKE